MSARRTPARIGVAALAASLGAALTAAGAVQAQDRADAALRSSPPQAQTSAAVATGRSAGGKASFRLEGRRLTLTLARAPRWTARTRRATVIVRCGDAWIEPGYEAQRWPSLLASAGERRLHVRIGTRVVRARFSGEVAATATWCGIRWRKPGARRRTQIVAQMRRRDGAPACAVAGRGRWASADGSVVFQKLDNSGEDGSGGWWQRYRACAAPAGAWVALEAVHQNRYVMERADGFTGHDGYAAWLRDGWLRRADLRSGVVLPVRGSRALVTGQADHVGGFSLGAGGRLAWVTRSFVYLPAEPPAPDQLNALTADGTTVTLATGPRGSLADPEISGDGLTVTWRENGVGRSAPMP